MHEQINWLQSKDLLFLQFIDRIWTQIHTINAMMCLQLIFSPSIVGSSSNVPTKHAYHFFQLLHTKRQQNLIQVCLNRVQRKLSNDTDYRQSILEMLVNLSHHQWAMTEIFLTPGFYEYLIDRQSESEENLTNQLKFDIVRNIIKHDQFILDDELLDQQEMDTLVAYIKQGSNYVKRKPAQVVVAQKMK
mmetsp:Transcript_480/g.658  ORF Transcript_480/g.658 Transcript_480/m.658 type:complete len:189 (+) Transcript_480:2-568(+)